MYPTLIEIGSKTAEKNSAQTNKQTDRQTDKQTGTTKIMVTWPWTKRKSGRVARRRGIPKFHADSAPRCSRRRSSRSWNLEGVTCLHVCLSIALDLCVVISVRVTGPCSRSSHWLCRSNKSLQCLRRSQSVGNNGRIQSQTDATTALLTFVFEYQLNPS